MATKLSNGTANSIRPQTAAKMLAGRAASTGLVPGAIVGSEIGNVRSAAAGTCGCR
jgi:hypothetical protein